MDEERKCQKCDCPTKAEEALVNGQIWCHSCADEISLPTTYGNIHTLSSEQHIIEITVSLCEAFKAIGIDISEADLNRFEQALYERGLNVVPRTILRPNPAQRS